MGLWFSASAVAPQLAAEWGVDGAQQAWLVMTVQLGFVVGARARAHRGLPDRLSCPRLIAASALLGAVCNAAIPLLGGTGGSGIGVVLLLRFLTGVAMAGVYPPGMKIVATWLPSGRGLGIGVLVGALTLGSAGPHLLNALPLLGAGGLPPWPRVLLAASGLAVAAAVIAAALVREGPLGARPARFDVRAALKTLGDRAVRLANLGYLGHMRELYAMWAWVPALLVAAYGEAGWSLASARVAGFAVVAVGAGGCVAAGAWADRFGRTRVTSWCLAVSGACCLLAGPLYGHPALLTALCLVWGVAVVADSAQFSAAVTELSEPRWVGTALTLQTCLGFLLTLVTLRLVPALHEVVGWRWVFVALGPGPVVGILAMVRLRRHPAAARMAGGRG
jgi:MFS family permease